VCLITVPITSLTALVWFIRNHLNVYSLCLGRFNIDALSSHKSAMYFNVGVLTSNTRSHFKLLKFITHFEIIVYALCILQIHAVSF